MSFKYVNANIKSKKELAQRMIDGEEFYFENYKGEKVKVMFMPHYENPFRYGGERLKSVWNEYLKFLLIEEPKWYGDITKPVPCFVSNYKEPTIIKLVTCKLNGVFETTDGNIYQEAVPLTVDDILQQ